jgi:hypothetical protein
MASAHGGELHPPRGGVERRRIDFPGSNDPSQFWSNLEPDTWVRIATRGEPPYVEELKLLPVPTALDPPQSVEELDGKLRHLGLDKNEPKQINNTCRVGESGVRMIRRRGLTLTRCKRNPMTEVDLRDSTISLPSTVSGRQPAILGVGEWVDQPPWRVARSSQGQAPLKPSHHEKSDADHSVPLVLAPITPGLSLAGKRNSLLGAPRESSFGHEVEVSDAVAVALAADARNLNDAAKNKDRLMQLSENEAGIPNVRHGGPITDRRSSYPSTLKRSSDDINDVPIRRQSTPNTRPGSLQMRGQENRQLRRIRASTNLRNSEYEIPIVSKELLNSIRRSSPGCTHPAGIPKPAPQDGDAKQVDTYQTTQVASEITMEQPTGPVHQLDHDDAELLAEIATSFVSDSSLVSTHPHVPLTPHIGQLISQVLTEYAAWKEAHNRSGKKNSSESKSFHSSGASGSKLSSKKRCYSNSDCTNIDNQSQPRAAGAKKTKTASNCNRRLACPYWKKEPELHRGCYKKVLSQVKYVKLHLYRFHEAPICCPCCGSLFEDESSRDQHARARECEVRVFIPTGGLTRAQLKEIHQRADPKLSEEQQWFKIWDVVFPGHPRPQSAYIDNELSEDICNFREFFTNEGAGILMNYIDPTGQDRLRMVIERGMETIYQQWTERRISAMSHNRPAGHVPAPSESNPSVNESLNASAASEARGMSVTPDTVYDSIVPDTATQHGDQEEFDFMQGNECDDYGANDYGLFDEHDQYSGFIGGDILGQGED